MDRRLLTVDRSKKPPYASGALERGRRVRQNPALEVTSAYLESWRVHTHTRHMVH